MSPAFAKQKYCSKVCSRKALGHGKNKGPCRIEGCDKQASHRQMCPMHYQRWRHHGSPLEKLPKGRHVPKERELCSVEGCDRSHYAKGFCSPHYHRAKKERLYPEVPLGELMPIVRPITHGKSFTCCCDECRAYRRAYFQEWRRNHIPSYRSHAERRATPEYQQRAAYRAHLTATASERRTRRVERKKARARQKQDAATTSLTVQYLREKVTWRDDPTPYNWRLSSFGPDGEETETALWDWQASRLADKSGDINHPDATAMMSSPCPTIQNLIDKALDGEQMVMGERVILAATLRRYQSTQGVYF